MTLRSSEQRRRSRKPTPPVSDVQPVADDEDGRFVPGCATMRVVAAEDFNMRLWSGLSSAFYLYMCSAVLLVATAQAQNTSTAPDPEHEPVELEKRSGSCHPCQD